MNPSRETDPAERDRVASGSGVIGEPSAHGLTRRAVLRGLVAGGVSAVFISPLVVACTDDGGSSASDPQAQAGGTQEGIANIGRRYRQERPEEDDREVLIERLGIGAITSPDDLRALDGQIAEDYGAGRTVRIDGWVLSVTECRAAALLSLL